MGGFIIKVYGKSRLICQELNAIAFSDPGSVAICSCLSKTS
jgi:hypothetical protein